MDVIFLSKTALFRGTTPEEIREMLKCLRAEERRYRRKEMIFRMGDVVTKIGLVLSGSVSIESDDFWGNKTVLDVVGPGQVFAETYACVPGEPLMVNAVALEDAGILFLDTGHLLEVCSNACVYHGKLIRNLLLISSQKNLNLSRRSFFTASKSLRSRLLSYLSYQASLAGSGEFLISLNRQQLADYLNVDRSALSNELSKMQRDGLLSYERNHFILSKDFQALSS